MKDNNRKGRATRLFFIMLTAIILFNVTAAVVCYFRFTARLSAPYKRISVKWSDEMGTVYTDLPAGSEAENYDLYVPKDASGKKSLVLYIHGGNFDSGDKSDGEILCKYLVSKGYVAAAVNYKGISMENDMDILTSLDGIYETSKFVKDKAAELGIELDDMAVSGVYGGGTMALLYAYVAPEKSAIPVKYVFEMTGPTSFDPAAWGYEGEEAKTLVNMIAATDYAESDIGSEDFNKTVEKISPVSYLKEGGVPILIAYGIKDKVVPVTMAASFSGKLSDAKIEKTFIEFPKSGHLMVHDLNKTKEFYDTMDTDLEKYLGQ